MEPELDTAVRELPVLTYDGLEKLAEYSRAEAHKRPKFSWILTRAAYESAVVHDVGLRLRGMAAWHLGRAANDYARPNLAAEAIERARAAFEGLDDPFWLAACDWQFNVLAWARPNLQQCLAEVEAALETISREQEQPIDFRNGCRMTLAYVQILAGHYEDAHKNIDICEQVCQQEQNQPGIIYCKRLRGYTFFRQSEFDEALVELENALAMARRFSNPVGEAFCLFRLCDVYYKRQNVPGRYQEAEAAVRGAISLFKRLDLQFWEGLAYQGLSNIYISRGDLQDAGDALSSSRKLLERFNVDAPMASLFSSLGWLETYRGNYEKGEADFKEGERICKRVGNQYMLGLCHMHLGELYLEMGRYQLSLRYLEQALENFQAQANAGRMAECGLRLSRCWRALGLPDRALDTLDVVEVNATQARQRNIFPYLYIRRAESLFDQGRIEAAVDSLRKALAAAGEFEDRTGMGLAQRLLGETLIGMGQMVEGAEYLEAAEKIALEVGLIVDRAACQVAWGTYYRKLGDETAARMAWRIAAEIGQNLAPDVVWQARAGLADLAEDAGEIAVAMEHYRFVVDAVVQLRQDMWQPALAGYFLKRPINALDKAIRLAARVGAAQDVLNFVEASKAQVLAKLFAKSVPTEDGGPHSDDLANLAAEIRWRQQQVRVFSEGDSLLRSADYRKLRTEIRDLVKKYDLLRSRVERQNQAASFEGLIGNKTEFDLEKFRTAAAERFGNDWVALDYYSLKGRVICVLITGDSCESIDLGYPGQVKFIVSGLEEMVAKGRWQQGEIDAIGRWLLPDEVLARIEPGAPLVIAPHRQLNYFPWSALTAGNGPLVAGSVPVIVPSLQSLMALMARSERQPRFEKGLLLAVSDFDGRHTPLPFVTEESESLLDMFPGSTLLFHREATWKNLKKLAKVRGLSRFEFMHFASHAFADTVSGRLSGLAMFDRDVWLDELREIGPFPSLVTLSACSGSKGKVYEGDEQVGLATTFLAAGASQVVASLWPIRDEEAALLMEKFYYFLLENNSPSRALALAQREAFEQGMDMSHWAGFRCTGVPV